MIIEPESASSEPDSSEPVPLNIEFEISVNDIKAAEHRVGVYNECPAAQALKRLGFTQIDVDEDRALLTIDGKRLFCKTPSKLGIFIDCFDNYESVLPSQFEFTEIRLANEADERTNKSLKLPEDLEFIWDDDEDEDDEGDDQK